jgi:hypothetical protein
VELGRDHRGTTRIWSVLRCFPAYRERGAQDSSAIASNTAQGFARAGTISAVRSGVLARHPVPDGQAATSVSWYPSVRTGRPTTSSACWCGHGPRATGSVTRSWSHGRSACWRRASRRPGMLVRGRRRCRWRGEPRLRALRWAGGDPPPTGAGAPGGRAAIGQAPGTEGSGAACRSTRPGGPSRCTRVSAPGSPAPCVSRERRPTKAPTGT